MAKQNLTGAPRRLGLVPQIIIGLLAGVLVGWLTRDTSLSTTVGNIGQLLGGLFVGALKAVAPVLIFVLVTTALSQSRQGATTRDSVRLWRHTQE